MKLIEDINTKDRKQLIEDSKMYILGELFTGRLPLFPGVMVKKKGTKFILMNIDKLGLFTVNSIPTQTMILEHSVNMALNEYEPDLDKQEKIKKALDKAYIKTIGRYIPVDGEIRRPRREINRNSSNYRITSPDQFIPVEYNSPFFESFMQESQQEGGENNESI